MTKVFVNLFKFSFVLFLIFSATIFAKSIVVTINPYYLIAKEIIQDRINVNLLIKPGANPHTYNPTVSEVKMLSSAALIIANGLGLDNSYLKTYKKVLYVGEKIPENLLEKGEDSEDSEEEFHTKDIHEAHSKEYNPHVWLSIDLLIKYIIPTITREVINLDPANKAFYQKNSNDLIKKLKDISQKFDKLLGSYKGGIVIQEHPSFVYLFRKYNIKVLAIEEGHGKQPSMQHIKNIVQEAKTRKLLGIFVSPQFDASTIKLVSKELGKKYYVIDGLGFSTKAKTIHELFDSIYNTLKSALK